MSLLTGILGRILFVIPFLAFGTRHLMHASAMAGMVPIPGGVIWIYITGVAMIAASLAAITGIQGRNAMLLLALMVIVFAVAVQMPGMFGSDPMIKMGATVSFYKDLGLAGGALILAGVFDARDKKTKAA